MKKMVKSWRFSVGELATKLKTMRLFAGKRLVLEKGISFVTVFLVAVSLLISCDDDDNEAKLWQPEMEKLRAAITPYDFIAHAEHDGYDTEVDAERERIIYSPGEVDANNRVHVVAGKDSINTRPAQMRPNKQPEAAKNSAKPSQEDDILSFNFLYYLFEKYKLQDIVD